MENRRAKASKDQRTRAATIVNDENRRLEETDLKPHKQLRKPTKSNKIRRTHDSTRPPLDTWLHALSAGARRTTGARIGRVWSYSDFKMLSSPHHSEKDIEKNLK
jgi:hypothetical protein